MLPFRQSIAHAFTTILVLVLGLVCTAFIYIGVRHLEHDKSELTFRQQARARVLTLQQQLAETEQVLSTLNRLFTTMEQVDRRQFQVFTAPILQRHPYLQAFNFHRYLDSGERAAYEAAMHEQFPGFRLRELRDGVLTTARENERYIVVDYLEPLAGNEAAFGLDVSGNLPVAETVQRAIDTGMVSSTPAITLAQGGGRVSGFLLIMPVYRKDASLATVAERRAAAIGDTTAVFDAGSLVQAILSKHGLLDDKGIEISVYVTNALNQPLLAYGKEASAQQGHRSLLFEDGRAARLDRIEQRFDVAGRPWRVVVSTTPEFFANEHERSTGVLIAGLLLTLLMTAFVQTLGSRTRRVNRLVEQRTAELQLANELLVDDIAARRKVEDALQLHQRAIEACANAVIVTSATGPQFPIEYVNPAFERITGYAAADILGKSCSLLWAGDRDQPEIHELVAAAREQREAHVILRTHTRDGCLFWSEVFVSPVRGDGGEVNHFVVALYDITATRRYQAELEFQANRDSLTGLANRSLLHDRLRQAIAYAQRYGYPAWVLFLNLDRFKFVNDTLGHRGGDQLLKIIAERLRGAVRESDTVARLSADEFMLLLPERTEETLSAALVQHLMEAVAQPVVIEGYQFLMESSVGIAVCPNDGSDPDTLIKHAGIAMYRAKETGRNNFQFYTSEMNEKAMERLCIESNLRHALERGELALHYQPQVDLRSNRVIGVEALLRWQHPKLGMVAPSRFISLAEEMGLIVPIGLWVLQSACRQSVEWRRQGLGEIRVAVNLSARQFYQHDLVASIEKVLEETGIAPHLLELELTESMMMNDIEHAVGILRRLKRLGVHLSIDDFGTGYSSLAYLKRFPIDLLKIDQSFVRDITLDPDDAAIVLSIISLAHSLRLKVIAEGVETADQLDYLRRHNCDCMQGYYFSRPLPAAECERLLRAKMPMTPFSMLETLEP